MEPKLCWVFWSHTLVIFYISKIFHLLRMDGNIWPSDQIHEIDVSFIICWFVSVTCCSFAALNADVCMKQEKSENKAVKPAVCDSCQLFKLHHSHHIKMRLCSWKAGYINKYTQIRGLCYKLYKFSKLFYGNLLLWAWSKSDYSLEV